MKFLPFWASPKVPFAPSLKSTPRKHSPISLRRCALVTPANFLYRILINLFLMYASIVGIITSQILTGNSRKSQESVRRSTGRGLKIDFSLLLYFFISAIKIKIATTNIDIIAPPKTTSRCRYLQQYVCMFSKNLLHFFYIII
jgi:hypothetical protein